MYVLKFGGTSMGSVDALRRVADLVFEYGARGRVAVVVSAMSGITDSLLQAAGLAANQDEGWAELVSHLEQRHRSAWRELVPGDVAANPLDEHFAALRTLCNGIFLLGECSPRSSDRVVAFGELLSSCLFAALMEPRISTEWADSRLLIVTDSRFGNAQVDFVASDARINAFFGAARAQVVVLPGFIAANAAGETTTLGRGGSDYTAAIIGAALPEAEVEIWTDVPGMMTADPRLVPGARTIAALSFQEAMELSHFG
ncbi:MAG: aspartate kinase, partial [Sphingobacteriales bacterium]